VRKDIEHLPPPDLEEPESIAKFCYEMNLKHVVITTVTRDDLPDEGAGQMIETVRQIRNYCNEKVTVEVLISDLQGNWKLLSTIIDAKPNVLNHNIETVKKLYPLVRPQADYERSLFLLQKVKELDSEMLTKSGFMVGLGENNEEVLALMDNLRVAKVDILTIGQYMQPTKKHIPVVTYVHPETFLYYQEEGLKKGFKMVESGPLVRSSYRAEKARDI
jgi:lipoic acid synthetase